MSAFYRKRPVVIEAAQFVDAPVEGQDPMILEAAHEGLITMGYARDGDNGGALIRLFNVHHLKHGELKAIGGDWLIKGEDGELYPCTDERFRAIYEPVEKGVGSKGTGEES